jgi:DNA-binding NarL/FixJ family response regulator
LRAFLTSRRIDVCGEAVDGKDTIEKVKELKPSLVLLDIYMPQVSGVAAAYEIRKISPHTKIVFFSNYDEPKHEGSCRLLGGDAFVSKSAGIIGLIATLAQFLPA